MTNIPVELSSAVPVDEALTFARRRGDVVELTLELPQPPTMSAQPELVLRHQGRRGVHVPVTTTDSAKGLLLHASVPASRLAPGLWRVLLDGVAESDGPVRLQARLVVDPRLPLALLTGPRPSTVHAPPPLRTPAPSAPHRMAVSALDAALGRLPEERARRYRGRLKAAYGRLRGARRG